MIPFAWILVIVLVALLALAIGGWWMAEAEATSRRIESEQWRRAYLNLDGLDDDLL